jgi:hypothetical protein
MFHTSNTMTRNGMYVSDITRNLYKLLSNNYFIIHTNILFKSEYCFKIQDHYAAYYEHLKYGFVQGCQTDVFSIRTTDYTHGQDDCW